MRYFSGGGPHYYFVMWQSPCMIQIFDISPISDRFGTRYADWIPISVSLCCCSFSCSVLFCEPGNAYLAGAQGLQCSQICRDQYLLSYSLQTLSVDKEYYLESLRLSVVSPFKSGTFWTLKVAKLF